jgi:CHAD domain-containing protein
MSARATRTASRSTAAAAEEILRARLDQFTRRLRQAAKKKQADDPEAVHQLRIATRRARAALELFADYVSAKQRAWFSKVLRKARKAADHVRNLDVYRLRLEANQSDVPPAVLRLIRRQRRAAFPQIIAVDRKWRKSGRLAKKQKKLLARLTKRVTASAADQASFPTFAAAALRPVQDEFLAATRSRDTSPSQLHELRIAGKHLRYTLELLSDALPVRAHKAMLGELAKLQDALGAINDHATALELLAELAQVATSGSAKRWLRQQKRLEKAALETSQAEFVKRWTQRLRQRLQDLCEKCLPARPPQTKRATQVKTKASTNSKRRR